MTLRVTVSLDRRALRRWHLELLNRLASRPDTTVGVRWVEGTQPPVPPCVATLFALERLVHGLPEGRSAPAESRAFARFALAGAADLAIDLTGDAGVSARVWRVHFDGVADENAAQGALLEGRSPVVTIVDATTGEVVAGGRPGSETPGAIVAAFEDLLARVMTLVCAALDGAHARPPPHELAASLSCRLAARRAAATLAHSALHRIYRLLYRAPHWRVGWRLLEHGPDVIDRGELGPGWRNLPDDGFHFYADPFPITVAGQTWLFVEDFDHRLGRGIVSAVAFGPDGPRGVPQPVLEGAVHLSYPHVFTHAGEVWMVPESVGARRVDLYRATRLPDRWEHAATLLDGVEASDATLFEQSGRWWMLATVRDGGSYSDALHLWSAPALPGPWQPHCGNPILVDITAARPAGRVVARGGRLLRPVQDNRAGYGAALAIAAVTRLDEGGFAQEVVSRLTPGPTWPGRRLHTLNRAGSLECIDGSAMSRRGPAWGRAVVGA